MPVPVGYRAITTGDEWGEEVYKDTTNPFSLRTRAEFGALFAGFDLLDPGVVWTPQWRPDHAGDVPEHPEHAVMLAGVARLP